jgi:hypothetical protein
MLVAGKPIRAHWRGSAPAGEVSTASGKPYEPSVRAHCETVLRCFYDFHLVLQSHFVMFEVLSLVVACAGAGLMASSPAGPVVGVGSGMGGVGQCGPESSDFVAG